MEETGVENTEAIDLVMQHGETGEFLLIMIEPREWDGSHERLVQLQDKLNTYLTYALDGQFHAENPEAEGRAHPHPPRLRARAGPGIARVPRCRQGGDRRALDRVHLVAHRRRRARLVSPRAIPSRARPVRGRDPRALGAPLGRARVPVRGDRGEPRRDQGRAPRPAQHDRLPAHAARGGGIPDLVPSRLRERAPAPAWRDALHARLGDRLLVHPVRQPRDPCPDDGGDVAHLASHGGARAAGNRRDADRRLLVGHLPDAPVRERAGDDVLRRRERGRLCALHELVGHDQRAGRGAGRGGRAAHHGFQEATTEPLPPLQ